ncbi:MAG: methionine aminotransferase [Pseudomonadota bacterium]
MPPLSITSKLPQVGTTIFTVMSKLATEHGAINLSQGFPSFDPPEPLLERFEFHLRHGANQYAPMPGEPALCSAIADKIERMHGYRPDPVDELTVCTGATEGLFCVITAVVRPGDEVIVLDPAYDAYEPAVALAGGITKHVPMLIGDGEFRPDWQGVADTLTKNTRLLILNFPHNPTGAILSTEDLDIIAELLRDSDVLIAADEVYEHILFDNATMAGVVGHDELRERSFAVSSFGKTLHATGWKVGYVSAPPTLSAEFRKLHQFATFAVNTPAQQAIADFLTGHATFIEQLSTFYQQKRDRFVRLLDDSRLELVPSRSTFFQLVDYSAISEEADTEIARRWTVEHGVASIPLSVFCQQPLTGQRLRFCFAKDDATLEDAAETLCQL